MQKLAVTESYEKETATGIRVTLRKIDYYIHTVQVLRKTNNL